MTKKNSPIWHSNFEVMFKYLWQMFFHLYRKLKCSLKIIYNVSSLLFRVHYVMVTHWSCTLSLNVSVTSLTADAKLTTPGYSQNHATVLMLLNIYDIECFF